MNVADPDDVVALRKQLAPLFPAPGGGAGIEDHLVDNGDEPHAMTGTSMPSRRAGAGRGAMNTVAGAAERALLAAGTKTYRHGAEFASRSRTWRRFRTPCAGSWRR